MARDRKLRKQPKLKRMQSTASVAIPHVVVPSGAKKRRKRNRQGIPVSAKALRGIFLSSRWISLALLAMCVWSLFYVGRDEAFFLTEIPVEGATSIPISHIVETSGLAGTHIFAADPNLAAAQIGQMTGIVSATVTLQWPNEARIHVAEELPVAVWEQAGQQYWISDSGGLIPARVQTNGLLLIQSEVEEPLDQTGFVPSEVLQGALLLRKLRPNIDQLYYRPGTGLSYQDGRGWRVAFGSGLDMDQKLAVYEAIVENLLKQAVTPEFISVRNKVKPYYRVAQAG